MAPKYADRPLSGEGARQVGGRWNPQGVPALYLTGDRQTAIAEMRRLAHGQGRRPEDFLPRLLVTYAITLQAVLDLRDQATVADCGLRHADLVDHDRGPCAAVGEAARYIGMEGVVAPSATGEGIVIAVFVDRLKAGSAIRDIAQTRLNELDPN